MLKPSQVLLASDGWSLRPPGSFYWRHYVLVRGGGSREIISVWWSNRFRSLWPWALGLKCFANDDVLLTWLELRKAFWVDKRLCSRGLAVSPECVHCIEWEETIEHCFFHCSVLRPLCRLIEDLMVRMLYGKFFVLEANYTCSNVVPLLTKA